jgi:hypothetical protein
MRKTTIRFPMTRRVTATPPGIIALSTVLLATTQALCTDTQPVPTRAAHAEVATQTWRNSNDLHFTSVSLEETLKNGAYGMIESTSRKFASAEEAVKRARFKGLSEDLRAAGIPHRRIIGAYRGNITDRAYLVVKPASMEESRFKKALFMLGRKYSQKSVIYSASTIPGGGEKRNYLIFTTGEHAGTSRSGFGFTEADGENYCRVTTTDGVAITIGTYRLDDDYEPHPELLAPEMK